MYNLKRLKNYGEYYVTNIYFLWHRLLLRLPAGQAGSVQGSCFIATPASKISLLILYFTHDSFHVNGTSCAIIRLTEMC